MADSEKKYWFKRKRYGWGWTPVTMQAWVAVISYLVFVVGCTIVFSNIDELNSGTGLSLLFLVITSSTLSLLWFAYSHGPMPKWRWGKKPDDNIKEDF